MAIVAAIDGLVELGIDPIPCHRCHDEEWRRPTSPQFRSSTASKCLPQSRA